MWRYYERGRNHDKPSSFPFSFQKTSENDVSHTYYMCLLSNFNIVFPVDPGGNVPYFVADATMDKISLNNRALTGEG